MLIIAHSLRELHFGQLMEVYAQSNSDSENKNPLQAEQDFYMYLRESFFSDPEAFVVAEGTQRSTCELLPLTVP